MLNKITHFVDTHPIGRIFQLGGKRAVWKRVTELTTGVKIAIEKNGEFEWDEIVSIKKVGRERVYDIEVEGTHNFVGNGIIAHNTIAAIFNGGNVGIGSTSPGQKLDVVGGSIRTDNQFISTLAIGTAPLVVTSTTLNTNLNADLLDNQHGSYYAPLGNINGTTNYVAKFTGTNAIGNSLIYDTGTNVGIGTTTTTGLLTVNGDIKTVGGGDLYLNGNDVRDSNGTAAITFFQPTGSTVNTTFTNGNVGIGTTIPASKLDIQGAYTNPSNGLSLAQSTFTPAHTSGSFGGGLQNLTFISNVGSTNNQNWTNTVGLRGISSEVGTIAGSTGTITGAAAFMANNPSASGATITNSYGLYIVQQKYLAVTNGWGIWQDYASDKNYFAGNVGIGTTPSQLLHVKAGATANAIMQLESTTSNGYGAIINYVSKTAGGTSTTWNTGTGILDSANSYSIYDTTDAKNVFTATTGGNVGIGTTNPSTALQVVGTVTATQFTGPLNGTATSAYYQLSQDRNRATMPNPNSRAQQTQFDFANASIFGGTVGNYGGVMTWAPYDGTTASTGDASYQIGVVSTAPNAGGYARMLIRNGIDTTWNSWQQVIISDQVGNVGIGTTTTTGLLTVNGDIKTVGGGDLYLNGNDVRDSNGTAAITFFQPTGSTVNTTFTNGNVGIGTTSVPDARLDVSNGGTKVWNGSAHSATYISDSGSVGTTTADIALATFGIEAGSSNTAGLGIRAYRPTTGGTGAWNTGDLSFALGFDVDSTVRVNGSGVYFHNNGNIGVGQTIPAQKLDVTGTIHASNLNGGAIGLSADASGNIIRTPSDARLKENVQTISSALDKVMQLHGVTFSWIDKQKMGDQMEYGLIAQEVAAVVPELTATGADGIMGVKYENTVGLLINAIQEQHIEVSSISVQLANLDATLTSSGDIELAPNADQLTPPELKYTVTQLADGSTTPTIVTRIGNFAQLAVASMKAGFINAQEISTQSITIAGQSLHDYIVSTVQSLNLSNQLISPISDVDRLTAHSIATDLISPVSSTSSGVTIALNGNTNQKISIQNESNQEVSSLDAQGNATFSGNLTTGSVSAATLSASLAYIDTIHANHIETDSIRANQIEGVQAVLDRIYAATLSASLITGSQQPTTDMPISSASALLSDFSGWSASSSSILALDTVSASTGSFSDYLEAGKILGVGTTADSANTLGILITHNSIQTLEDTIYIQPTGVGKINLLAGRMVLQDNGEITITSNVALEGNLTVHGKISALGQLLLTQSSASDSASPVFAIADTSGATVAAIDASGSATFNTLTTGQVVIASPQTATTSANTTSIQSNATAGTAVLPAGQTELFIPNTHVTDNTLVYLTPQSDTQNQVLYVKTKDAGQGFTVGMSTSATKSITFTYWIIKVQ